MKNFRKVNSHIRILLHKEQKNMLIKILIIKSKSLFLESQKIGAIALNGDLSNFRDDLVFKYEDTGKNILQYNDNQDTIDVIDYKGESYRIEEKTGACLIPTTYVLKKSLEYSNFIDENSSTRSIYKEKI